MEQYKNLGGKSAIVAYEIGNDSITVQFRDGTTHLYNNQSAGAGSIEQMKSLAASGQGLNRFIGRVVKKGYVSKS